MRVGKVLRVIGPAVDIEFFADELPPIYNAIRIKEGDIDLVVEVAGEIIRVALEPGQSAPYFIHVATPF